MILFSEINTISVYSYIDGLFLRLGPSKAKQKIKNKIRENHFVSFKSVFPRSGLIRKSTNLPEDPKKSRGSSICLNRPDRAFLSITATSVASNSFCNRAGRSVYTIAPLFCSRRCLGESKDEPDGLSSIAPLFPRGKILAFFMEPFLRLPRRESAAEVQREAWRPLRRISLLLIRRGLISARGTKP